ncbi:MAG: TIGR04283 family arsenosugar biosynthesis glycosyltransferase [Steroidobacteraceae bacterium]
MQISIIIPVLNEAVLLPEALRRLGPFAVRGAEIIVVDGGSSDGSAQIAGQAGLRVLRTQRGRARQMNAGAAAAHGDVYLFLHADTTLPADALDRVQEALREGARAWGRFDVALEGDGVVLALVAWLINLRSRLTGIATGDQAMFVTRRAFRALGGFPDQPLMEDVELSRRLLSRSRPACLRERVVTSARRWQDRGTLRTILLMWRLRWLYWRGRPADELVREYR